VILAIDQGTTGTRCLVVDESLRVIGSGYAELRQSFPQPGWVEHDPEEIWRAVLDTAAAALAAAGVRAAELTAIGITNQRETTVVWERTTGRPVYPAIVWQDRRTAERCLELPVALVRERTGLVPDPYFSATKLEWVLARAQRPQRELCFGTVDAWIVWQLTKGGAHVTDVTNASRTMLLDLERGAWDDELLGLFGVDASLLPAVTRSSGVVAEAELLGARVPVAGIAGDQQAALFGQACFAPGEAKATYGTGCFLLANTGGTPGPVVDGLLRTSAAVPPQASPQFATEGSALVAGAAVQWLRDGLGVIEAAGETEALATSVGSTGGVVFVPALAGLGSPYWDPEARGLVTGLTRGTTRAHLVRAALEAMAHQVADIVEALPAPVAVLRADGGASRNSFLMQLQADLLGCPVEVAADPETTALGVAALAGLGVGAWRDTGEVAALVRRGPRYEPRPGADVDEQRAAWRLAVRRARLREPAA
jgi:glycerol kinase